MGSFRRRAVIATVAATAATTKASTALPMNATVRGVLSFGAGAGGGTTGFAGTTQVAGTIAEVSQGANQTGAASSQLLSSAKQLSDSTNSLQSEIDGFLRSIAASA